METAARQKIEEASMMAVKVLLHNMEGPYAGLPRTAGWGYPEPYTRDLMISILGIAVAEEQALLNSMKSVLQRLADNQTLDVELVRSGFDGEYRHPQPELAVPFLAAWFEAHREDVIL